MRPAWRRFAKIAGLLFGLILAYQILLHPSVVQYLIQNGFSTVTRSQISLDVRRSSLLHGFHFENLSIDTNEGDPIIKIPTLKLTWFLPGLLAGHAGIREFGLYDAKIYVTEKDGIWNLDYLSLDPNKKKPKREPEPIPEEIYTFLPLKLYANIDIRNLQFYYHSETRQQTFEASGLDVRLAFITDTFNTIPLNTELLELFETLVIAVNPYGPVRITYNNGNQLEGDLTLSFRLFRQTIGGQGVFSSLLNLDATSLTLNRPGYASVTPGLIAQYQTSYNQDEDALLYRDFSVSYNGRQWLAFEARVTELTEGNPNLDLSMLRSEIALEEPGQFLAMLTNGTVRMGGYLSLYPVALKGPLDKLEFRLNAEGQGLYFHGAAGHHNVPQLNIEADGAINLYEALPFLQPPDDYNSEEARKSLAYGLVHRLDLKNLSGGYNGANLQARGNIQPGEGVDANIRINGLNLGQFLAPHVTGIAGADIEAQSTESFDELDVSGTVTVYGGRYSIGRSRSGINNLTLITQGKLIFKEDANRISIQNLNLNGTNGAGLGFLNLAGSAELVFADGKQSYESTVNRLSLNYAPMITTLPARLRYPIAPYGAYLKDGLVLSLQSSIHSSKEGTSIQGNGNLTVPAISQDALRLTVNTNLSENRIAIPMVQIAGLRGALNATLTGSLNTGPSLQPYLQFRLNLAREQMLPVHENISIQGGVQINLDVNPQMATGGIYINDLDIQINTGNCQNTQSPACRRMRIEKLNLNLPIRHNMALKDPVQLSDTSSGLALTDTGFRQDPNFTVRFVASSHTPGGTYKPESHFYLGALDPKKGYGISARMDYRRNVFMIDWIDARIFKPREASGELWTPDGTIQGRRLFFNAADLAPAHMEYAGFLQIHNLNLAPFFPDSDTSFDGIISGDLSFSGRDLTDPIRNTNMRLSVYRISEEFTGFAVRLLIPNDAIAFAVNNTLEIPAIQVELKGGLIYTSVKVKRPSLLSLSVLVRPSEEEIRQERIPLAEFLERARTESSRFTRETANTQE